MERSESRIQVFTWLIVVVTLFIGLSLHSVAQKQTSTLSGRVVDVEGNPVAKSPVFVSPVKMFGWAPFHLRLLPHGYFDLRRALTNFDGRFTITEIPSGPIYFGALPQNIDTLLPDGFEMDTDKTLEKKDIAALRASGFFKLEPDFEVLSIHIQGVNFYPRTDYAQIVFGVKPGTLTEDVVVTVKPRMRIQGRVLFKDSTPVANARLRLSLSYNTEDGNGHGSSGGTPKTDTNGYFVYYLLDEKDDSAFYTFYVRYMELVANTDPVLLNPGDRLDGLTFTFDSDPIVPKPLPHKAVTTTKKPTPSRASEPPQKPKSDEVWIVNPENGHAYKKVHCKTRDDAIAQVTEEKAHLVTINNAKEQTWLSAVFGPEFCWIGLKRVPPVGTPSKRVEKWEWHNGEPLTYQNWLPDDYFSESLDASKTDYAVITFVDGKWYPVSTKSVIARMTKMAIIEKADMKINRSSKKK